MGFGSAESEGNAYPSRADKAGTVPMDAEDVMAGPVYALRPEDSVHHARSEMVSRGVSKLPVVADGSELAGILTKSDLVFSSDYELPPGKRSPLQDRRIREVMTEDVYAVSPGAPVADLVAEMVRRDVSGVPVVAGNDDLEGIVTETDLLPRVAEDLKGKVRVHDVQSEDLETAHPQSSLSRAIRTMDESAIHQLPVLEDGDSMVGILTMSDIVFSSWFEPGNDSEKRIVRNRDEPEGRRPREQEVDGLVDEAMTDDPDTVAPDRDVRVAAQVMEDERYNALPVLGDEGLEGIVSRTDLLRRWADMR
jgi:CBS domain-containing protein